MEEETTNNGVLNLDEMLGDKKLTVKIQGKAYPIRTVKSLTPEEFGRVKEYSIQFTSLTEEQMRLEKDSDAVMEAIDEVLEIIAPKLPRRKFSIKEFFMRGYKRKYKISLAEAAAIFQFWAVNNRSKKAPRAVKKTKNKVS